MSGKGFNREGKLVRVDELTHEDKEWEKECDLRYNGYNILVCEVSGGLLHNGIYLIQTQSTEKTIKEMTEAYRCQVTLLKEYERRLGFTRLRNMVSTLREYTVIHNVKWGHLGTASDVKGSVLSPVEKIEALLELKPSMTAGTEAYRIEL